MRWLRGCEDVSLGTENCPLLEEVVKQCNEDRDREHTQLVLGNDCERSNYMTAITSQTSIFSACSTK